MEKGVDTDLYSRQIGTFGMETMGKLIKLKILILGMRGLGVEIAKNIILSGPNSVTIYDPILTQINDLGSNFYLSEEDVNIKNRDIACLEKLKELNPYVNVSVLQLPEVNDFNQYCQIFCEKLKEFNVVVFTEIKPFNFLNLVNDVCRQNNIKFIYTFSLGLTGFVFTDFGPEHIIIDQSGDDLKTYSIKNITKEKNALVTIDTVHETNELNVGDGSFVQFKNIEGMTELNSNGPYQIKLETPDSFRIGDTSNFNDYIKGGEVCEVHLPRKINYFDFNTRATIFTDDYHQFLIMDGEKIGRSELLYMGFIGIHDFYCNHNFNLPELNNMQQANEILNNVKQFYDNAKQNNLSWFKNIQKFDEKVILNLVRFSRAEICPITSFFGGIVAQEIIKTTGKYDPIDQWLILDFFETIENINPNAERKLLNSRYDDQIAIFGNEIHEKIINSNIFMIGAGATGCEFLKNFAMMGFCTNEKSLLTVTDNDNIEISNLSRQFLFRKKDVGQPKSITAGNSVKNMNKNFNINAMQTKVCKETENIFNDDFWQKQNFIINAVDSNPTRKYIDTKVISFEKCSIDSGTLGTKAHLQMIIPHKTITYNDNEEGEESPEIPMCTLRNFPSLITHCIEWARSIFNDYFTNIVTDVKNYFLNFDNFKDNTFKEGTSSQNLEKIIIIKDHIEFILSQNFDKVIEYAVKKYTENFDYNIQQLLYNFPPDYKNLDGTLFWSGSKKLPHNIPYNPNDELCLLFVKKYSFIIANALNIPYTKEQLSDDYIKNISSKIKIPKFEAKKVFIATEDSQLKNNNQNQNSSEEQIAEQNCQKLLEELKNMKNNENINKIDFNKMNEVEFEKDHDENGHIDFIHACSNLRAKNYNIDECDRSKTKIIAGKIIPTIMTTTAAIAGIVSLQLYTLLQTHELKFLRNCYFNLSCNYYLFDEPVPAKKMIDKESDENGNPVKMIPEGWTTWDKILIEGSKTCQELMDYIKEKYDVDVDIIMANEEYEITDTFFKNLHEKKKNRKIEDIFCEVTQSKIDEKINYLWLKVSGKVKETKIGDKVFKNVSAELPVFKYVFK